MAGISGKVVTIPNGETIGYRETGTGERTVVLIHGNMASSKHWDILMSAFPCGYHLFAVDLRGFGMSSYHNRIETIQDFSEDVAQFTNCLDLNSFSMIGWSLGGAVAMQFAIDHGTKVEKLVLIESMGLQGYPVSRKDTHGLPIPGAFLSTRDELAQDPCIAATARAIEGGDRAYFKKLWESFVYTHQHPPTQKYEEYLNDVFSQRNTVDVAYAYTRFNISYQNNGVADGDGSVSKIRTPTLVIHGDRDEVIPLETAREIARGIGAGRARLEILEDSGHSPLIDAPERLVALIAGFLERGAPVSDDNAKREIALCEYNALSSHMNTGWQISYTLLGVGIGAFGILVARSITLIELGSPVHPATTSQLLFAYFEKCITDVFLFVFPFVLTLIIGQITRAHYLISFRLADIAKDFTMTTNLWQVWPEYVEQEKSSRATAMAQGNGQTVENKQEKASRTTSMSQGNGQTVENKPGWLRRAWDLVMLRWMWNILNREAYPSLSGSAPFFVVIQLLYMITFIIIIASHIICIIEWFVFPSFNPFLFIVTLFIALYMIMVLISLFRHFICNRIKEELDPTVFCTKLASDWKKTKDTMTTKGPSRS